MEVPQALGALTMDEILKLSKQGTGAPLKSLAWDSKYLPLVLGAAGVTAVFLVAGAIKKRRRKK